MICVKLAWLNIKGKKFKYTVIFALLFITSLAVYAGEVIQNSMKKGLEVTRNRIGADIIVVPDGFVSETEDALFKGKACTLNFKRDWESVLKDTEGVDKTSSQLYLASLSDSACCDGNVQLIAVDLSNDFSVGPWIEEHDIRTLKNDEIILGASFNKKAGDSVTYYNKKFRVLAVMEETGAGYDNCAFISYEAAREMAEDERNKNSFPFSADEDVTSMVLIQVEENEDPMLLKKNIEKEYGSEGIAVYSVTSKVSELAGELTKFEVFGTVMNVCLILLAGIALFAVFTITTFQRKNEIGSMLTVGINKRKIINIFLLEYVIVSGVALLSAIVLISVVTVFFQNAIKNLLEVPFILVQGSDSIGIILRLIAVHILVFICSVSSSFYWIYKKNPSDMIKEVGG